MGDKRLVYIAWTVLASGHYSIVDVFEQYDDAETARAVAATKPDVIHSYVSVHELK